MIMYVAVDIGCIECGAASSLIGIYNNRQQAKDAADAAKNKYLTDHYEGRWTGQHSFVVFESSRNGFGPVVREGSDWGDGRSECDRMGIKVGVLNAAGEDTGGDQ